MLDRILNINPQEKYKSGLKVPSNHHYTVNRHDQERHHSRDSALFSPLAKLMSKLNWKILNIDYPSNDEILFNFMVNDLEFQTTINLSEIYTNTYQEFIISKIRNTNGKKLNYNIGIKTEKYKISFLNEPLPIETAYLSMLFERVYELNFNSNYNIQEQQVLDSFVNGIEDSINDELNYILKILYTFISSKEKKRVKNNFVLKTHRNIPIIMQKVAIIYAE
jgi:hypothetical protein